MDLKPLAKVFGLAIIFLSGFFFLSALLQAFGDVDFVREIVFKFNALGIDSLWVIAVILLLFGFYIFNSE